MKLAIIFFLITSFASQAVYSQRYKHKSEAELERMTPAQRFDEWVNEQVYHRYDLEDPQLEILRLRVSRDGLTAVPRMIEYLNGYDPTRPGGQSKRKGERFDTAWLMFGYIDVLEIRLRASEEGRRAMDALQRAIERMRAAGFEQKEMGDWELSRIELAKSYLKEARGINPTDTNIRFTLRFLYKIRLSEAEMLEFSNFLTARDPTYVSWSKGKGVQDPSEINAVGVPVRITVMIKPERYYEAYLEFKKAKR